MAGIEVAGLVLGAIPIVISGIEYYVEGIETFRAFRQWEAGLRNISRALHNEHTLLLNACGLLMSSSSLHADRIALLLNDYSDDGPWKDPEVQTIIKSQLGASFNNFKKTLENIHGTVEELREKLGIDKDRNIRPHDPASWKSSFVGIKFGFRKKHYDALLKIIHNETFVVERLVRGAQKIESPLQSDNSNHANLRLVRNCARSVYHLICSSWRCTCQNMHTVNLYLSGNSSLGRQKSRGTLPCFRVAFCFEEAPGIGRVAPWYRTETDIRLVEDLKTSSKPADQIRNDQLQPNQQQQTGAQQKPGQQKPGQQKPGQQKQGKQKQAQQKQAQQNQTQQNQGQQKEPAGHAKPRRTVRFLEHSVKVTATAFASSTMVTSAQHMIPPTSQSIEKIEDFCKVIASLQTQPRLDLGLLIDPNEKLKHAVYAIESNHPPGPTISLTTVLAQMAQDSSRIKKRFNLLERVRLGVLVADNVVQLCQTPWLNESWKKDDILFVDQQSKADLEHPFVSKGLVGKTLPSHQRRTMGNEGLFTLGVLLIELWFGTTLKAVCEDAGLSPLIPESGDRKGAPDRDVIEALVDCLEAAGCTRYADVVSRCLLCTFDCRKATFEEEDFLQAVYTGVVSALQNTEADLARLLGP